VLANSLKKSRSPSPYLNLGSRTSTPVRRIKKTDAAKLQDEYAKLVEGLQEAADDQENGDAFMANPRK
jgi:hypothetical protein